MNILTHITREKRRRSFRRRALEGFGGELPTDDTPDGPVLDEFDDDLELDPPEISFNSTQAGTLQWDFDTSATPPVAGSGNIGTGTQSVELGTNSFAIDIPYRDQTGYLHFRVGTSNTLTTQIITVPGIAILDRFDAIVRDRATSTLNTRV